MEKDIAIRISESFRKKGEEFSVEEVLKMGRINQSSHFRYNIPGEDTDKEFYAGYRGNKIFLAWVVRSMDYTSVHTTSVNAAEGRFCIW